MKRRVRSAGVAVAMMGAVLAMSGGTAHAQEQQPAPRSGGLINITGPLIYNTGDFDIFEDVLEHISIPILGQAVHQMYDWAKFDGKLFK
ncbi:hypothetical protein [Streptomyces yaizuensis]|uniref:Uncharacterized protein n=1 Tax=Streptomyces yaizuensis TaxID=2989713 RepID=A0ABQ5P5B1_9ACTN|nr:hypothetical protein [Streptomyces sp. YSPA8]GLF97767.1 hypothetical protein SYYSPA8_25740 [Streptomyces sp. YSPA8]